jgi:hypothetical protein
VKKNLFLTCICIILLVLFLVPPVLAAERSTTVPAQRLIVITAVPTAVETTASVPEGCSCLLPSEQRM